MNNPFKHIINQYLKFSRSDRNAILILGTLILVVIIANTIVLKLEQKPSFDLSDYAKIMDEWDKVSTIDDSHVQSLFHFNPNTISESKLDSLQIPIFIKKNLINYRKAGGKFNSVRDFRKIYGVNDSIFMELETYIEIEKNNLLKKTYRTKVEKEISGYFDPNKANFVVLKEFGFNNFQANNLLNYRRNGGVIRNAADLLKIYGIDSLFYSKTVSFVEIEKEINTILQEPKLEIESIEINCADSTKLVRLKGIGSVYAMRIIKYRNLLGGFYAKEQLLEVYNFPEETFNEIENYIYIDTTLIKKIRINFAEYSDLLRHPYLNKKQTESILNYRNKNGVFSGITKIQLIEAIDKETFIKLQPYFTCR